MSIRELKRVEVLGRVKAGDVTLRQASEVLAISYRHAKRLWKRIRGDSATKDCTTPSRPARVSQGVPGLG